MRVSRPAPPRRAGIRKGRLILSGAGAQREALDAGELVHRWPRVRLDACEWISPAAPRCVRRVRLDAGALPLAAGPGTRERLVRLWPRVSASMPAEILDVATCARA